MDNKKRLNTLLAQINATNEIISKLENGEILSVLHIVKERKLLINLFLVKLVDEHVINSLKSKILEIIDIDKIQLNISYQSELQEVNLQVLNDIYIKFLDHMSQRIDPFIRVFKRRDISYVNYDITIVVKSNIEVETFNKIIPYFENYLKINLVKCNKINVDIDNSENVVLDAREKLREESHKNNLKIVSNDNSHIQIDPKSITPIINLTREIPDVLVQGKVFDKEHKIIFSKKTNKEYEIFEFKIYDGTSSINVKRFKTAKINKELYDTITKNSWIQVRGKVIYDKFIQSYVLEPLTIVRPQIFDARVDNANVKRIELHTHTKMSTTDAVINLDDAPNLAASWQMDAIALTDHNNVQAYPKFWGAAKKAGIKPIFGLEADFIGFEANVGYNSSKQSLKDATFVIFDIETTGLSVNFGKIIELSAIKFKYGQIDYFEEFLEIVNINEPLSDFTKQLTNISDEMIQDGKEISEVLKNFKKFSQNCVLVAHNAKFDKAHMEANYEKYLNCKLTNPILDTLWIARIWYPEFKSHTLKVLTSKLKVKLVSHHRAIDDSIATGHVFVKMIQENELENYTVQELIDYKFDQYWKYVIPNPISILVKNEIGLKNLYKLTSNINTTYFHKSPRLTREVLKKYREGLLIGSGCENSLLFELVLNNSFESALEEAKNYDYIELPPINNIRYLIEKDFVNNVETLKWVYLKLIEIGKILNILVVAVSNAHNLNYEDAIFRHIFTNSVPMHKLNNKKIVNYPSMFLRTTEEMLDEFQWLNEHFDYDICNEIVIKNTHLIAQKIEQISPLKEKLYTPILPNIDANEEIKKLTYEGAHAIYGPKLHDSIEKRIEKELKAIIGHGFAVIYLVFRNLVKQSNSDGYLVGSRGSVGSSIVAFLIGITEVNAMPPHYVCLKCHYLELHDDGSVKSGWDMEDKLCPNCNSKMKNDGQDIPFETFLGFKGDKVPDIDLNFSGDYQPRAHNQLKETFGHDKVFRAGTISTVATKTAFGYVKAFEASQEIVIPRAEIDRLVIGTEGVKRTTGQHPGGIIIVPQDMEIFDFTPIQFPADDITNAWNTTHFDYRSIHDNLLKADILGHDDPTILKMLFDLTNVDPKSVPLNDKQVMSLFNSTNALGVSSQQIRSSVGTYGVPEFGTAFVRKMLESVDADRYSSLVQISGLSHGTDVWLGNAEILIKEDPNITINDVIGCRDDIMVTLIYSGLEPSDAFNIMEKVRKGFGVSAEAEQLMIEHNVPNWYIESCKKIKYMFPKAHASAYVLMAIRIAWYKINYPIEFYATYFSVRPDVFDLDIMIKGEAAIRARIEQIVSDPNATNKDKNVVTSLEVALEMCARGFYFQDVDLVKSHVKEFLISEDKQSLIPPFSSIDGLGISVANEIFNHREAKFNNTLNIVYENIDKRNLLEELKENTKLNKNHYTRLERTFNE